MYVQYIIHFTIGGVFIRQAKQAPHVRHQYSFPGKTLDPIQMLSQSVAGCEFQKGLTEGS